MKSKHHLSLAVLVLGLFSFSFANESFAGGKGKVKEKKEAKQQKFAKGQAKGLEDEHAPSYDENLMPQAHKDFVFSTEILMDVRRQAMERTQQLIASFANKQAHVEAARIQREATKQDLQQAQQEAPQEYPPFVQQSAQQNDEHEEKGPKSSGQSSAVVAARQYFKADELGYGSIREEQLLQDYWSEMLMTQIHQILRERYPNEILEKPEWAFNAVGGTYARFAILMCHTNEYLGLWGVTTPQYGYSGSYPHVDFWDFIISGQITSHGVDSNRALRKNFLAPGPGVADNETLSPFVRGSRKISNYESDTYMMDYARGNVLSALDDGAIAPYRFDTHDWRSLRAQLRACAVSVTQQIKNKATSCFGCGKE